jgi:hypothetical protein
MTNFDTVLRERFARLDAAIPELAPPQVAATPRGRHLGRRTVLLIAATAILLGVTAIVAIANTPPRDPAVVARNEADELRLRNDLGAQFADLCLTPEGAKALIRQRLDALGLSDWTIDNTGRAAAAPCAGAAPAGDIHAVLIMPSMGMAVASALDQLQAELLANCATRDDAVAQLRSRLVELGIANPKVKVGGITQVPRENADAFVNHVENGCYVLGGAQFDQTGHYTWFISGLLAGPVTEELQRP